jgi:hypothetical protein
VLVKDQWVGPHEQALNVRITCWYMGPISWCSCVTTWLKPFSPTPRLSWGRKNEVTQGDNRTRLSWSPILLPGVGVCFVLVWTSERLTTWTTWDVWSGTLCKSGFPLQGVYWFESPWLSDMGTTCLWQSSRRKLNGMMFINELMFML